MIAIPVTEEMLVQARAQTANFERNSFSEDEMPTHDVLTASKIGEWGFALCCGLRLPLPPTTLRYVDVSAFGERFDVKNLDESWKHCLHFPRKKGKEELRQRTEVTALALTRYCLGATICQIIGVVRKKRFLDECKTEPPLNPRFPDTPYMHERHLTPIEEFLAKVDHHCIVCGEYGPRSSNFGETWFCGEHAP